MVTVFTASLYLVSLLNVIKIARPQNMDSYFSF